MREMGLNHINPVPAAGQQSSDTAMVFKLTSCEP